MLQRNWLRHLLLLHNQLRGWRRRIGLEDGLCRGLLTRFHVDSHDLALTQHHDHATSTTYQAAETQHTTHGRANNGCCVVSQAATALWVSVPVIGCSRAARSPVTPRDLIMNLTARQYHFSVLITAAWRACLPVIADDGVPIYNTTGAEPLRAIGIGMAIPRTACVLIGRPVYSAAVLVFNFSTGELVVVRLVGAARPPRQAVVANDVASVRFARCT